MSPPPLPIERLSGRSSFDSTHPDGDAGVYTYARPRTLSSRVITTALRVIERPFSDSRGPGAYTRVASSFAGFAFIAASCTDTSEPAVNGLPFESVQTVSRVIST